MYNDTLDDLRGMIHIKDFVAWIGEAGGFPVRKNVNGSDLATATGPRSDQAKPNGMDGAAPHGTAPSTSKSETIAKALSAVDLNKSIASAKLRRDVLFVPPSMPAVNLLLRMQSTRVHLAMVVDEYGGTDGLVSIEDLVEEIVGDIEDEHDDDEGDLIVAGPRGEIIAEARTPIDDLESYLGLTLVENAEEEDVDTLGGLVFALAGRVPVRGELVRHGSGIEFEVLDADPRRIKKLKVHLRDVEATGKSPAGRDPGAS